MANVPVSVNIFFNFKRQWFENSMKHIDVPKLTYIETFSELKEKSVFVIFNDFCVIFFKSKHISSLSKSDLRSDQQ